MARQKKAQRMDALPDDVLGEVLVHSSPECFCAVCARWNALSPAWYRRRLAHVLGARVAQSDCKREVLALAHRVGIILARGLHGALCEVHASALTADQEGMLESVHWLGQGATHCALFHREASDTVHVHWCNALSHCEYRLASSDVVCTCGIREGRVVVDGVRTCTDRQGCTVVSELDCDEILLFLRMLRTVSASSV